MSAGSQDPGRRTLLFVGAGPHQRPGIRRARELGVRVVAVDANEEAPGFADAHAAEAVDFKDVAAVVEAGRRHGVDSVMTVASDRAVPVVAAVAEALGLPGIGSPTAHAMTNKVVMRRRLAEAGVSQPRFAAARSREEAERALAEVGLPAVLKPADSSGQRGLALLRSPADLNGRVEAALAHSRAAEVIVERFHEGVEVNALVVARGGECEVVTLSDRVRAPGTAFGVALAHLYPASLPDETAARAADVAAASVRALGLRDGVAYPQVLVADDGDVRVVEVAARVPGGQMAEVARHGAGVDLVEVALRQALGEPVPDDLVRPRFRRPLAIRFLTAEPGPLRTGTVKAVGGLEHVLSSPGVVQAEVFLAPGDSIRPVLVDADRHGYVIALGETSGEALERADRGASVLDVQVA